MTYELSSEVIKILDDLARRFGLAIDWTSQNVMPYVTELLGRFVSYKIATNIIPVAIFITMIGVNIWFWRKLYKSFVRARQDRESNMFVEACKSDSCNEYYFVLSGASIFLIIFIVFSSLLSTIFGLCGISDLLKLVYIPELYIVEYISQYM